MPSKKDDLIKMYNNIKHCEEMVMKEYDDLKKMNKFDGWLDVSVDVRLGFNVKMTSDVVQSDQ